MCRKLFKTAVTEAQPEYMLLSRKVPAWLTSTSKDALKSKKNSCLNKGKKKKNTFLQKKCKLTIMDVKKIISNDKTSLTYGKINLSRKNAKEAVR